MGLLPTMTAHALRSPRERFRATGGAILGAGPKRGGSQWERGWGLWVGLCGGWELWVGMQKGRGLREVGANGRESGGCGRGYEGGGAMICFQCSH